MKQGMDIEAKLQQARDFSGDTVSKRPPPPMISSASSKTDGAFPSRESIFNKIMEALRNEQMSIVGVWGMGGVGKTILAQQVAKRAEEEKIFDKVVMASNISQTPDISELQTELARTLGLRFGESQDRSVDLMNCMKNQNILVILDDIWGKLDLAKIGIPHGDDHKGCKLLLTSREYKVVVTEMMAQQVFHLPHLQAEEAWSLFKMTAGDSVEDSPELKTIAGDIVKKCEGLPVAIVTVASALKNKGIGEWKNALNELRRAKPTNVRRMSDNVYSCLELSYNHLVGDEVKSLFLLCGLLGGRRISKDRLLLYAMGLNMFEGLYSLEEATNKLITLVRKLIASSLLLETEEEDDDKERSLFFEDPFVKMLDVVRDVARSIASKDGGHQYVVSEAVELREWERRGNCRNYNGISLERRDTKDELPPRLVCPELELFLLNSNLDQYQRSKWRGLKLRIPEDFFRGLTKLRVLHMSAVSLRPPPSSLGLLANLRTLCLIRCQLGDMIIIGEMKALQVLTLAGSNIVELTKDIGQLKDLRVLDAQDCTSLRIIPRNVISSLSRLECLSLRHCWKIEWGRDGETNNNRACFSEIKDLPRLRILEVYVPDPSLIPENIGLNLVKLTRYVIWIGLLGRYRKVEIEDWKYQLNKFSSNLTAGVKVPVVLLKSFSNLFRTCKSLSLVKVDGIRNVVYDLAKEHGLPHLECLGIRNCDTTRHIVSSSQKWVPPRDTFCRLDQLHLYQLPDLRSVFYFHESAPILIDCFGKLRSLRLCSCKKLRCVMSLPMQHGRELNLFPRLQKLELDSLPNLSSFFSTATLEHGEGPMSILFSHQEAFSNLEILAIQNLKRVVEIWQDQFSLVSFSNLRELRIEHCHGISFVISRNMVQKLHNLEYLWVEECGSMKEVIQILEDEPAMDEIDFSKLKILHFDGLPKLEAFCLATCTLRFPSLERLELPKCPNMEFFCKGDFYITNKALEEYLLGVLHSNAQSIHETSRGQSSANDIASTSQNV